MTYLEYINFAGALVAFFIAARIASVESHVRGLHRWSWRALTAAAVLLAAVLLLELAPRIGYEVPATALTVVKSLLVLTLIVGFYFLYVRERAGLARLRDTATAQSERSHRLQAILELGTGLRASHSVEEVAQSAGDAVHDTLNYRENAIYLLDPDDDTFLPVVVVGGDESYDEQIRGKRIPMRVVKDLLKEEFRSGNVYFVDHRFYHWTAEEQVYFPSSDFHCPGPGHFHPEDGLFVPLLDHDDRVIGLFDLYNPVDGLVPAPETFQVLEIFANVTAAAIENARYSASLQRLAITDGLTGLYNHRHFQEMLATEVDRGLRYGSTFTLLMMDLDFFKNVNDRLGHQRGDEVLRRVSEVIMAAARSSDFVARYGGEEFIMILPETPARQAETVAHRVRAGVKEIVLEVPNPPELSISIGVADFPFCGKERESLIAAADTALMFAKRSGRDMVTHFSAVTPLEFDSSALEGLVYRLEDADLVTLEALAAAVDARDHFDRGHSARVVATVEKIVGPLGLDRNDADIVRAAARIYDVGKLVIPIEVLNRTDGLGDVERESIRRHPDVGRSLLESTMKLGHLLPVVGHHHERWDGEGYPRGLKGEEIPLAARVIGICDAYQAMVSDRPYRKALTREEAVAELRANAGTQFDPDLIERFIAAACGESAETGQD